MSTVFFFFWYLQGTNLEAFEVRGLEKTANPNVSISYLLVKSCVFPDGPVTGFSIISGDSRNITILVIQYFIFRHREFGLGKEELSELLRHC